MAYDLLSAAARTASGPAPAGLPPGILRFSLEFDRPADVAAVRAKLEGLLGSDGFDLRAPGEDATFLVLQFPGVLREQSAPFLFQAADELVDPLGLVSCTPDVSPGWIETDELGRDAPESVSGIVRGVCESSAPAPVDLHWAGKAVRADRVWAAGVTGQKIRVAQPDTGVADHRELDLALDTASGTNTLAGGGPPTDPLSGVGNPGHGTATSSSVASRLAGVIAGSAPGAIVVPIRCAQAVVLDSGAATAAAIDHARGKGCHVVTMSLGTPVPFPDLKKAIKRAVDAHMIVLAAAGNCVGLVVYPAWDDNVIAVAGVDVGDRPWKGTSRGPAVDIAAPAEKVYVASRSTPDDLDRGFVRPSQGTSFAVAITAGVAALWLSRYGYDELVKVAKAKGVTLQQLFRAALQQSARRPETWPAGMGPGVADAEALVALDPATLQVGPARASGHPAAQRLGAGFSWARFGAESGFLALDRAQRSSPGRIAALESPVAPRPSPALAKAIRAAGGDPRTVFGAPPPAVSQPLTPELTPRQAVRIVAGGAAARHGVAESASAVTESMARSFLQGDGREETLKAVEDSLGAAKLRGDADPRVDELRGILAGAMPTALDHLAAGGRPQDLRGPPRVALEALVRMTGRPAWRVTGGAVDLAGLDEWVTYIGPHREAFHGIFDAVGRVDLHVDGVQEHIGTGVMVAPGVVMTNRHVLDAIADPMPGGGFALADGVSINFDEDAASPARRFAVTDVLGAGPDRIGQQADIRKLDMAFLSIETTNAANTPAPAPLSPAVLGAADRKILVVGYPARPGTAAITDPSTNEVSVEILDRLYEIYSNDFGVKYASPGDVMADPISGDVRRWAFSHDATTLGGNSGSAIISLQQLRIAGLHFGGAPLRQNLAHDLGAVRKAAEDDGIIDPALFNLMSW